MSTKVVSPTELAKHNTRTDGWTAIHGVVYDVTSFLDEHPGGAKVMLKYAGADSTKAFDMVRAMCSLLTGFCGATVAPANRIIITTPH